MMDSCFPEPAKESAAFGFLVLDYSIPTLENHSSTYLEEDTKPNTPIDSILPTPLPMFEDPTIVDKEILAIEVTSSSGSGGLLSDVPPSLLPSIEPSLDISLDTHSTSLTLSKVNIYKY